MFLGLALAAPGQQADIGQPSSVGEENRAGQQDRRPPPPERTLGEMSTDRPDITDSTDIVGRARWQVESGVSLELDRQEGASAHSLAAPLAMFRVGLGPPRRAARQRGWCAVGHDCRLGRRGPPHARHGPIRHRGCCSAMLVRLIRHIERKSCGTQRRSAWSMVWGTPRALSSS